jgi:hypothetical protein
MAEIEGDLSFECAFQFAMIGPDSSVIEFAHVSATAVRALSPCVLGRWAEVDGSCFLKVDTPLILLASIATDGHA